MFAATNIPTILSEAEKFVIDNDRANFAPYLRTAEQQKMILGGSAGMKLICGQESPDRKSFVWDLYMEDIAAGINKLVDDLSRVGFQTLVVRPIIKNRESEIHIDGRLLFRIFALGDYRGVKLSKLLVPRQVRGWWGETIQCLPADMQLIAVYRVLYSPSQRDSWDEYLEYERELWPQLTQSLKKFGGDDEPMPPISSINDKLLQMFLDVPGADSPAGVLIGDYACELLGVSGGARVQFLSHETPDDIQLRISRALAGASTHKIMYVKYPLNIPSDFQLAKYTFYLANHKDQLALCDVFTAPAFEMIPYGHPARWLGAKKRQLRIAGPYVLLRFSMIDIWLLRQIGGLTGNMPHKIKAILQRCAALRAIVDELLEKAPEALFQLEDYAGVYLAESVAKKKINKYPLPSTIVVQDD